MYASILASLFGIVALWQQSVEAALYKDEVDIVDWKHELVGHRIVSTNFASESASDLLFHSLLNSSYNNSSSIVSSLDAWTGRIKWRLVTPSESVIDLHSCIGTDGNLRVALVTQSYSAVGEFNLQFWNVAANSLLWSFPFSLANQSKDEGIKVTFDSVSVYVAVGNQVYCVDAKTGLLKWKQSGSGAIGAINSIGIIGNHLFVLGDSQIAIWDVSAGKLVKSIAATFNLSVFGESSLYWLDNSNLYSVKPSDLGSVSSVALGSLGIKKGEVKSLQLCGSDLFIIRQSTQVHLVKIDNGAFKLVKTFESKHSFISNVRKGCLFPISDDSSDSFRNAKNPDKTIVKLSDLKGKYDSSRLVWNELITVVVNADGELQGYDNKSGDLVWVREESLSDTVASEFVQLPIPFLLESHYVRNEKDGILTAIVKRWQFHLKQLLNFGLVTKKKTEIDEKLVGDRFGFRQLVVSATRMGKLIALDSKDGKIVWSRSLDSGVYKLVLIRSAHSGLEPLIAVVIQQKDSTVKILVVDALTGEVVETNEKNMKILSFIELPYSSNEKAIGIVTSDLKLHVYPHSIIPALDNREFQTFLVSNDQSSIIGYSGKVTNGASSLTEIWKLSLPNDEQIIALGSRPSHDAYALKGRILGDRSVLYKYLNPNTIVFASSPKSQPNGYLTITVLDTVNGNIVYQSIHDDVLQDDVVGSGATENRVIIAQTENIIAYHYWARVAVSKHQSVPVPRLNVIDLHVNKTTSSDKWSSYEDHEVFATSLSFQLRTGLTSMAFTSTDGGIASKELIVATNHNQIAMIPRSLLDSRRPVKSAASLSAEEKTEGLLPYTPILEIPQSNVLSYYLQLFNMKTIKTQPTTLESSTLIFATGHDLYFTSRSPSKTFDRLGDHFPKYMPVLAIVVFSIALVIAKRLAKQKQLAEEWK